MTALKIPQGYSVVDTISVLEDTRKIIFVGYAGGHSSKVQIGNVIRPDEAVFGETSIRRPMDKSDRAMPCKIMMVHHFLEQDQTFVDSVERQNISAVDMETFLVFLECEKQNIDAVAILIITDLIDTKPFYLTSQRDLVLVMQAYQQVEDAVYYEIKH